MEVFEYKKHLYIRKDIEPLYLSAFPINERPPADYYFSSFNNRKNILYGFYEKETFVGFVSISLYKDICYIFFLAVSASIRNKGYGSKILSILKEMYKDYVLLLCYEEVDEKYNDYENRKRREEFYMKNGFKKNPLKTNEFGVIFQTAYIGNHIVAFEEYKKIFASGFGEKAVKFLDSVKE